MSIVGRAVKDSQEVARLAVDAAKNELVEHISPAIKKLIEKRLREGALSEDVDRLRRAADGHMETEFEEGKQMDMDDEQMESVANLFPGVNEVTEGDDVAEGEVPTLGEGEDEPVEEAADEMDETIELSESELERMYAEALQMEVDVSKGFRPIAEPHELGAGAKNDNTGEQAALADKKSGEHPWEGEVPPAKQDYTVKEIRQLVKRGMAENKQLRQRNAQLEKVARALHGKLSEMNLLNSKILHVNKFMASHRLTNEQKKTVIESIDTGKSVTEVKNIYGILESTFKVTGVVSENRNNKPRADAGKRRTSGAPNAKVLRESADKAAGGQNARLLELAGLSKLTNG